MKSSMEVSEVQAENFRKLTGHNARAVQVLDDREIQSQIK
jgi:carbonic anhydrase